MIDSMGRTRK